MLNKLTDIINPLVMIQIQTNENNSSLIFKEESPNSKISELTITGIPDDSIAFTLDYSNGNSNRDFIKLSPYINPKNDIGVNASCDLVILTEDKEKNGKINAVVIDLKSDKNVTESIQINNSILFINYLLELLKYHYNLNVKSDYYKRIIKTSTGKRPIASRKNKMDLWPITTKPNESKKSTIPFNRIIS